MRTLLCLLLLQGTAQAASRPLFTGPERQQILASQKQAQIIFHSLRAESVIKPDEMPALVREYRQQMLKRQAWRDPDDGMLSEARIWQSLVSLLYEFHLVSLQAQAETPQRFSHIPEGPVSLARVFSDNAVRFEMALDRLRKARMQSSFGGLGKPILEGAESVARALDSLCWMLEETQERPLSGAERVRMREIVLLVSDFTDAFYETLDQGQASKMLDSKWPETLRIIPGYRGVEFEASPSQVHGVKAGDRVEVLVTFEAVMKDGHKETVTSTILQRIAVLETQPDGLLLMLNPAEVQYAQLSERQGTLTFVRLTHDSGDTLPIMMMAKDRLGEVLAIDTDERVSRKVVAIPKAAIAVEGAGNGAARLVARLEDGKEAELARDTTIVDRWSDPRGGEFFYLSLKPGEAQAAVWAMDQRLPLRLRN